MAILGSEITTGADYASRRRRSSRQRRKRGLPLIRLFLLLVLLYATLTYREFGSLLSNRYVSDTRGSALLQSTAQTSALKPFTADLTVSEADSGTRLLGDIRTEGVLPIDGTDERALLSHNAYTRTSPASTIKIVTCLLTLEDSNIHIDDVWTAGLEIVVPEPSASTGSFQQGDKLTAEQALYCLVVHSGADTANMIAKQVVGGEEAFVEKMNAYTKELGATGTYFTNSHGLIDPDRCTTPYDLYLILHEAMKYPGFQKLASRKLYTTDYVDTAGQPVQKKWFNTNYCLAGKVKLPEDFFMVAAKTGTTLAAGACLAQLTASEFGKQYYSVILKSPNHDVLYQDTSLLLQKNTQVY